MPAVDGEARYAEEDGIMPVVSPNSNGCSSNVTIIVVERGAETFPSADRAFDQTDLDSGLDPTP